MGVADDAKAGPGGSASSSGSDDGTARPIGVPKTYAPPDRFTPSPLTQFRLGEHGSPTPRPPAPYYDGAEYGPTVLSPEARWKLQQRMAAAGVIGPKQVFRRGVWDETTAKAFRDVLSFANQNGVEYDDALDQLTARGGLGQQVNGAGQTVGGAAAQQVKPGHQTTLTAPLDLEAQVQSAAQARLGRKLRKNEISKFISIYHGLETKTSATMAASNDREALGQNTTVTTAPNVAPAADNFIDTNMGAEAGAHDVSTAFDTFKKLIGAGNG